MPNSWLQSKVKHQNGRKKENAYQKPKWGTKENIEENRKGTQK